MAETLNSSQVNYDAGPERDSFFVERRVRFPEYYIPPQGIEGEPKARHILEARQLTPEICQPLFERAEQFKQSVERRERLDVQLNTSDPIISFFEEPSTRTRFSFEAAAKRLGFATITTEAGKIFSSRFKGESSEDTAINLMGYNPAAIVARTAEAGDALRFARVMDRPMLNGGDGKGEHPTQALLDMFTIQEELGRLENLNIVMGGDLLHGRTVRSLVQSLAQYTGNSFTFVSPTELKMGEDIKRKLDESGIKYYETNLIEDALPWGDVVYWTRLQAERITDPDPHIEREKKIAMIEKQKDFCIGKNEMILLRDHAILMHPLPRVEPGFVDSKNFELQPEILPEVDTDPRSAYFRQSQNGMYARMALLEWVLDPIYGPEGQYPPI